jgi:hypothetical protein
MSTTIHHLHPMDPNVGDLRRQLCSEVDCSLRQAESINSLTFLAFLLLDPVRGVILGSVHESMKISMKDLCNDQGDV